jgi:ribosome-associated protein
VPEDLELRPGLVIPAGELRAEAARSGGPGGQNVNKVASKVVLRFAPLASRAFDEAQRARLTERLGARLNAQGELVIHASRHRERLRNLDDARQRLASALLAALARPRRRVATKPTRGSKRRRLEGKRRRGEVKRTRGTQPDRD